MAGATCDVCGGPSIGVASSSLGAISFAYCAECNAVGAEPYGFTVGYVALFCGRSEDAIAEWARPIIEGTAQRAGKMVTEFWSDVKAYEEKG